MIARDGKTYKKRTLSSGRKVFMVKIEGLWKSTGEETIQRAMAWAMQYEPKSQSVYFKKFASGIFDEGSLYRKTKEEKGRVRSLGYWLAQRGRLKNYLLPAFGDLKLDQITLRMVDEWLISLNLATNSKNKLIHTLKDILRFAVSQNKLTENPLNSIELFIEKNKERESFIKEELDILFPEDAKKLVKIWGSLMWACYFLVIKETGHRPGEQAVLTWQDLWSQDGKFGFIIDKAMESYTRITKNTTKTGYSRATRISEFTYKLLLLHLESSPFNRDIDLIFSICGNRGIIPETANKHLKICCKEIGLDLKGKTLYCFRHTANTNFLVDMNPHSAQFLMGHRTQKETDRYNHPDRRLLVKKATKI